MPHKITHSTIKIRGAFKNVKSLNVFVDQVEHVFEDLKNVFEDDSAAI